MTPFDLPPVTVDALHADRCRAAEVRECESYLSNPPDDGNEQHLHVVAAYRLIAEGGSYGIRGSDATLNLNP